MIPNSSINAFPGAGRPQIAATPPLPFVRFTPNSFGPIALGRSDFLALQSAGLTSEQRYNQQQIARVSQAATNLARTLGLSVERQALVNVAAQYYTLGKDFSHPFWTKSGLLTEGERQAIQNYPLASVNQIIALSAEKRRQGFGLQADQLNQAIPIVLTHKYNYAGGGYPGQTIAGEQIPIEAQIIGLVDAYYAMTSPRPYRPVPMSPESALQALQSESGTRWNPAVVSAFFRKTV